MTECSRFLYSCRSNSKFYILRHHIAPLSFLLSIFFIHFHYLDFIHSQSLFPSLFLFHLFLLIIYKPVSPALVILYGREAMSSSLLCIDGESLTAYNVI